MAIDPVCNMVVDEREPPATASVAGRTYYFCAMACKQAFLELGLDDDGPAQLVDSKGKPLASRSIPEGIVSILFTDLEDSTKLVEELGQERAQPLVRGELDRQDQAVKRHQGYTVKRLGDGMMIAFAAPRQALLCAVDVQSDENRDARLRVRIGLHAGEVIVDGDDYFGKTVIMAARIMARARGGEIVVSEGLCSLLDPPDGWRYSPSRRVQLKGFDGWQRITALEPAGPDDSDKASTP